MGLNQKMQQNKEMKDKLLKYSTIKALVDSNDEVWEYVEEVKKIIIGFDPVTGDEMKKYRDIVDRIIDGRGRL